LLEGDLCTKLEDAGGEGVGGGEGGGVEVDDFGVLGLVEGSVDVYEFCGDARRNVSLVKRRSCRSRCWGSGELDLKRSTSYFRRTTLC